MCLSHVLGVEERERKRLTSVSYTANVVGLDSEDHVSSATTPKLFLIKNVDDKLQKPFSLFTMMKGGVLAQQG